MSSISYENKLRGSNLFAWEQIQTIKDKCCTIKPLVIIPCITYNHEAYLRDALEGFVMQQTTFPFIAVVHDDASTDNTVAILKEYAEKYPNIILPIFENENQWSKHDGTLGLIVDSAISVSGAKYIAFCEGDDYWIDPLKLQKQVDFLESHSDFTICFHNAEIINAPQDYNLSYNSLNNQEYFSEDIIKQWIVPTASILCRSTLKPFPQDKRIIATDIMVILNALSQGRGYGMSDKMSVYRVTETGLTIQYRNRDIINKARNCRNHFIFLQKTYKINKRVCKPLILRWENIYIKETYRINKIKGILLFFQQSCRHPIMNSKRVIKKLVNLLFK